MIWEAIVFSLLVLSVGGWAIWDKKQMEDHARRNADRLRKTTLQAIDNAGKDVSDFPKSEDALRGDRHLSIREIIDINYACRRKQNERRTGRR